jgi:NADH:ubiquinone oxidoreductase subunit 3 (subunit A)
MDIAGMVFLLVLIVAWGLFMGRNRAEQERQARYWAAHPESAEARRRRAWRQRWIYILFG